MAATLQRKSSGGMILAMITKIITKEIASRNYFVAFSARMVHCDARDLRFASLSFV